LIRLVAGARDHLYFSGLIVNRAFTSLYFPSVGFRVDFTFLRLSNLFLDPLYRDNDPYRLRLTPHDRRRVGQRMGSPIFDFSAPLSFFLLPKFFGPLFLLVRSIVLSCCRLSLHRIRPFLRKDICAIWTSTLRVFLLEQLTSIYPSTSHLFSSTMFSARIFLSPPL